MAAADILSRATHPEWECALPGYLQRDLDAFKPMDRALAAAGGSNLRYSVQVTKFENKANWRGQWELGDAWGTIFTVSTRAIALPRSRFLPGNLRLIRAVRV